jgi:hypothetical protein
MTRVRCFALGGVLLLAMGCSKETSFVEPPVPSASINWANAVSDTGQLDMRVVDIVSNAGFFNQSFRGTLQYPQGIQAGTRRVKVFIHSSDQGIAQQWLVDTTFSLVANQRYTFYLGGYGRAGQTPGPRAVIASADPPAVVAGQIHVRVINLAPNLLPYATTPVDGWVVPRGAAPLSGSPTIANQAFGGVSTYTAVPVGTYLMAFTATGTTTPILFQANMPTGAVGTSSTNPTGGTLTEGAAITALLVPQSVPLSQAPFSFAALQSFTSLTTTGTTAADTIATAVTPAAHGLATGDTIVINGAIQPAYRGTVIVKVVNPTTFTYRTTAVPTAAAATGYPFWFRPRFTPSFNGGPISTLTATGTTATVVTQASHGLATNDIVTISGANEAAYNGSFAVVTVVSGTSFTYSTNGAPSASPATGIPIFRAGANDFTRPNVLFIVERRPGDTAP